MIHAAELLYLFIRARLLMPELVAWEADDDKSALAILLVEGLQPVVLRSEAALRCRVHNEEHLSPVVGHADLLALVREGCVVVNRGHSACFT